jgi:hypothetical protein
MTRSSGERKTDKERQPKQNPRRDRGKGSFGKKISERQRKREKKRNTDGCQIREFRLGTF